MPTVVTLQAVEMSRPPAEGDPPTVPAVYRWPSLSTNRHHGGIRRTWTRTSVRTTKH